MTMRRSLIPLTTAAMAVLITGCGQQTSEDATVKDGNAPAASPAPPGPKIFRDNWPDRVPTHGLTKGMALPLETYMVSYAEEITVQQARDNAEISCMRRYGFDSWRTEDLGTSPPPADNASNMPRRYGLSDLAEAQTYGYRTPPTGRESTPPPDQDTPDAATVLLGRQGAGKVTSFKGKDLPEGGCVGEVNRKVGSLDAELVERLSGESFESSQQTPAVTAAMAQWSSCMKDRGHRADTVWDTDELFTSGGDTAGREEIKIATDDVECKTTTGLIKVWFDEETAIQKQLIEDNKQALNSVRSRQDKTLSNASGINAAPRQ